MNGPPGRRRGSVCFASLIGPDPLGLAFAFGVCLLVALVGSVLVLPLVVGFIISPPFGLPEVIRGSGSGKPVFGPSAYPRKLVVKEKPGNLLLEPWPIGAHFSCR